MEQQNAAAAAAAVLRGDDDAAANRRKSLGRLRDMSVAWDADPPAQANNKYTRNDDAEPSCPSGGRPPVRPQRAAADGLVDVELTARKPQGMSAMEMESIKERERAAMLRKCAQHLELESVNGKYTRENFKRGILNKVSPVAWKNNITHGFLFFCFFFVLTFSFLSKVQVVNSPLAFLA